MLVGSTPPPYHGSNVYFNALLHSDIKKVFTILHVNTSDHRSLDNIGVFDFENFRLGLRSLLTLSFFCIFRSPHAVYVPIAQNKWGFLRDGLFILLARVLCKARIVIHFHGGESFKQFQECSTSVMQKFVKLVLSQVEVAVVLGNRLKDLFEGSVGRVAVVPNGIEIPERFSRRDRGENGKIMIGYLGNLVRSKGILDFIAAADLLSGDLPNLEYEVAGSWWEPEIDLREEVLQFLRTRGLDARVRFLGHVEADRKKEFFKRCDIFVFPSINEGLPLVILEAMSAGLPVIAYDEVGAVPEVIENGVTGILAHKGNIHDIATAVRKLVNDPHLRLQMGEAGRVRVETHYAMDHSIHRLIRVLAEVAVAK